MDTLSTVVSVQEFDARIVQVTLHDRASKNSFSTELLAGLREAFTSIQRASRHHVVLLTGYDNYFCCGGTREGLLALHERRGTFVDNGIYSLALQCEIPVIAAMQGHAIGGGFVFGLFADFVVLGRESVYTTNFMQYGFTPGMGATYVLPAKLGMSLAHEMLLGARTYRGADLEKRGVPFAVLPRAEVLGHAMELARDVAAKPRPSLIALKDHLVAHARAQLPATIAAELSMHEKTFHHPAVRERINAAFDAGIREP